MGPGKDFCDDCFDIINHSSTPASWNSSVGLDMYSDTRVRRVAKKK